MKAKVAYTYGWNDEDIDNMPYRSLMQYWLAINVLEAEEQLRQVEVACAPMLDKGKRKNLIQSYKAKIRSGIKRTDGRLASIQDVAKALAGMMKRG